jgi:hypothetical protein
MSSYMAGDICGDDELAGIFGKNNIFRRIGRAIDVTNKKSVIRQAGRDIDPTNKKAKYNIVGKVLLGAAAIATGGIVGGSLAGAAKITGPSSRTDQGTIDASLAPQAPTGYHYDKNGVLVKNTNYLIPALAGGAVLTTAFILLH